MMYLQTIIAFLRRYKNIVLSVFPSSLPIGMSAFEDWSKSIIEASGMPDNDSIRFALAASIMHLGPTVAYKPKLYFILTLRKGAANQIAHAKLSELKNKQAEAMAKSQAEATASPVASSVQAK